MAGFLDRIPYRQNNGAATGKSGFGRTRQRLFSILEVVMKQPLSSLTRWVVAGVLAGLETAASGAGFLDINGQFSRVGVPGGLTEAPGINDAGHIVGSFYDGHTRHG